MASKPFYMDDESDVERERRADFEPPCGYCHKIGDLCGCGDLEDHYDAMRERKREEEMLEPPDGQPGQ
jgi:hypothetical protein